jgi:hypothetical protein
MKRIIIAAALLALVIGAARAIDLGGHSPEISPVAGHTLALEVTPETAAKPRKTLKAFASEAELKKFLASAVKERSRRENKAGAMVANSAAQPSAPINELPKDAKEDDNISNNQHAGVDEGGIVKVHGDHLVILRRGRLFTVRIGDDSLRAVSAVDAFGSDVDPGGAWYDEMLISGSNIAVIGYSYQRGGTEIGLFKINDRGGLKYRATYHMRSNDYYSSRNYASRLIGSKLIFYTPLYLYPDPQDPWAGFPAVRKWREGATEDEFKRIVSPARIFYPARESNYDYGLSLHTVTSCDLGSPDMKCEATAVFGPAGRVFYVSPSSVYIWTTDHRYNKDRYEQSSMLYQMPLDGGAPRAVGVSGSPVDQFSFLESDDSHLNVMVRSEGHGDGMWSAEFTSGDAALLRLPLDSFGDGSETAPTSRYRKLSRPDNSWNFQNRFVGDYLLYGVGNSWWKPGDNIRDGLYAVRWKDGSQARRLPLRHSVDRIEALGGDAVVVGTHGSNLYFTPVSLDDGARLRLPYVRKNAAQGELRSHGFFYKAADEDSGMLGLPIMRSGRSGYKHLVEGSASILFLKNRELNFSELGTLDSRDKSQSNDNCKASCVDWYGNARPIFIRGRVFALLGYELVEGAVEHGNISERRRVNFSPGQTRYAMLGK